MPSDLDPVERRNLVGLSRAELAAEMAGFGAEPFRARQLWHWIYHRGATDFAAMTNLAKGFRERLAGTYALRRPGISQALASGDGTRKWLLRFDDAQEVETVHIPEADRGTLCVSSQVGCTLTCTFCHTGTQRLVRNLSAAEIVGQIMIARDALGEWPSPKGDRQLTNIVLMGMGEPLYNFDNVAAAMKIAMDPEGLAVSRRKITLSTSGVVPMIARCGAELGVNLAISLHAVTDELRDTLVPLNKKYPWPGAPYECSSDPAIKAFSDIVFNAGYSAPVRTPRGRDIFAACGQLKSASVRARRTLSAPVAQPAEIIVGAANFD
jgi:23S rRNA (adenine2503-C2)-methyltransferase